MAYIFKTGRAELLEQIRRHKNAIRGKVLDAGAGNYPRYRELFDFDEYVKMDTREGSGIDLVGKIENIPSTENSFDSVVCTQVLGDVYDLQKAFSELHRVLRTGGHVLITESLFDPLHDEPNDFWRFTEHSLRRLAEDAGFEVKVLERRGGYRSVLSQLKTRYWIERLQANKKWFTRMFSLISMIIGKLAIFLDKQDRSYANTLFTHGYILVARKKHA